MSRPEIEILYVSDNGKGFDERGLEAIMAEGSPDKQEGSTGSFGIGHLTAYGMSGLQYICYASKQQNGTLLATGHAILSSHDSEGQLHSNNGYYVQNYEAKFDEPFTFFEPGQIPPFLQEELAEMDCPSGSIVAILGFNRFRQDENSKYRKKELHELIREAVAENFALAIWANQLEVEVYDAIQGNELIEKTETLAQIVDRNSIEQFLTHMARPDTGTKEQTLKAQQTLDAIETFRTPSASGRLPGRFSDCQIYLRNRARTHRVSIWRNGMLITRRHRGLAKDQFHDKKPFDAVVMLAGKEEPREAHDIVKGAETPLHDRIQANRLSTEAEKKELRKWFEEVREWISERAEESGGVAADLEDEILIDVGSVTDTKPFERPRSLTHKDGEESSLDNSSGKNQQQKHRVKRPKVTRKTSQIKAQGRALSSDRYRVRIKPEADIANSLLKMIIDSGQDPSCSGIIFDTSLSVREATVPESKTEYIVKDGLVKLGNLEKGKTITIDLAFSDLPQGVDLQQISLDCLLGSEVIET